MFHSSISNNSFFSTLSPPLSLKVVSKRAFISLVALMAVIGSSEVYGMEEKMETKLDNAKKPHDSKDKNHLEESFAYPPRSLPKGLLQTLIKKANEGDTEAQEELVVKYYDRDFPILFTQFHEWEMIKKKVGEDPRYNLFVLYRCTDEEITQYFPTFIENLKCKAEEGNPDAQTCLGLIYIKGYKVVGGKSAENDKIALKWNTAAAEKGKAIAQCVLAGMYISGRGVEGGISPKNYKIAFKLFTAAAKQGSPEAKNCLGLMYSLGQVEGGKSLINDKIGLKWYTAAAKQGSIPAQKKLISLYQTSQLLNLPEAFRWSMVSKSNTESSALFNKLFVLYPTIPQEEGPFHELIEDLNQKISSLLAQHQIQKGLHNPKGNFKKSPFAIPELHQLYSQLERIEIDALGVITSLSNVTPGFMLSCFDSIDVLKIASFNMAKYEYEFFSPYLSFCKIDKDEYVNIGEDNIAIAKCFQAYLTEIDNEFAGAEEIIKTLLVYHTSDLNLAKSKLISCRARALKKEDNESCEKFQKQKIKVEELESDLNPLISAIQQEKGTLREIKEDFKTLLVRGVERRNREFFEEYPHLMPR